MSDNFGGIFFNSHCILTLLLCIRASATTLPFRCEKRAEFKNF